MAYTGEWASSVAQCPPLIKQRKLRLAPPLPECAPSLPSSSDRLACALETFS